MQALLEKIRHVNRLLQESVGQVDLDEMARVLSDLIGCDAYLADRWGQILGYAVSDDWDRLGALVLARSDGEFGYQDLIVGELVATLFGLELLRRKSAETKETARRRAAAKLAIETLSYSELEAAPHIFAQLKGRQGLVVSSNVADRLGVSRSVIINALRKLKSAGMIDSRNVGIKGTFIKILNEQVVEELWRRQGIEATWRDRVEALAADWRTYGSSNTLPVLRRLSTNRCASAASARG